MWNRFSLWVRVPAYAAAVSLLAAFVFTRHAPWQQVLREAWIAFVFSTCCAALSVAVLPRLGPLRRRLPFPFNWLLTIVTLLVLGTVGSLVALLLLLAAGYFKRDQLLAVWLSNSLQVSIFFTLLFGIGGTLVGELRAQLHAATLALRTKERDAAEARRLAVEAQLASLESRVDPHFFFNTLNSIAALVRDDPAAAERVVEQFAALMRASLERSGSPLAPLRDELEIVRSYLDIQRVRFGSRLRYSIDVSPAAGSAAVPRLALQTLVENSIKYAVSARVEGAAISVSAAAGDGRVKLRVRDDGPGFDPARLPDGHGLELLRARLAMTFDTRAHLRIESCPDGTEVVLDLPLELSA